MALLVINADQQRTQDITLPSDAERYTLTAQEASVPEPKSETSILISNARIFDGISNERRRAKC